MAIKIIKEANLSWLNIDAVDQEAVDHLRENYNFHHLDLEDVASESTHIPKVDIYRNYLFVVLHFPQWNHAEKKIDIHEIDFFIGDGYFISIPHDKTKEMKTFFYRCMKNRRVRAEWMSGTSGYLFYQLIEALFHETRPILSNIGKHISIIENEIFTGDQDINVIKELAVHRRNILSFRRIIDPERHLLSNLSHIRKPFLDESLSLYFDDVRDYLDKLWAIVETYKETTDGLHITVESLINQRTNRLISALTVISVALLPLNLLSGIYGMNIDELPFAHNPAAVWAMLAGLATLIILIIVLYRRKRWL
ncbi:MAG: Mg2 transporter protein CorA family protein [Candidatus Magasanikbacteria bacterium GW2011_GWA2_56_11]|uniref:Mg2 transporter protein CorA family protein n=1 Tax=Candidatus Magasanikbacteria bacterium GW2011_GWA2_56_11 TaxID=1619044 RepID=A0A0G1YDQ2_9BACT|nr:MAG: Mg2 transporter protein CorA family protein [Candidatus Magasanikbacteria bacterium GW2011_GWA2_56_11]